MKATIYDFARMCKGFSCSTCPLCTSGIDCISKFRSDIDTANEIILNWCKEHPVKTRQSKFLEKFPNAVIDNTNILGINSCDIDGRLSKEIDGKCECDKYTDCSDCRKVYWLAEVEE